MKSCVTIQIEVIEQYVFASVNVYYAVPGGSNLFYSAADEIVKCDYCNENHLAGRAFMGSKVFFNRKFNVISTLTFFRSRK